jgi:hypothetical protein
MTPRHWTTSAWYPGSPGTGGVYVDGPELEPGEAVAVVEAAREKLLGSIVANYADHDSWRCGHPDRYPWDKPSQWHEAGTPEAPDCPCGLIAALRSVGLNGLADEMSGVWTRSPIDA